MCTLIPRCFAFKSCIVIRDWDAAMEHGWWIEDWVDCYFLLYGDGGYRIFVTIKDTTLACCSLSTDWTVSVLDAFSWNGMGELLALDGV